MFGVHTRINSNDPQTGGAGMHTSALEADFREWTRGVWPNARAPPADACPQELSVPLLAARLTSGCVALRYRSHLRGVSANAFPLHSKHLRTDYECSHHKYCTEYSTDYSTENSRNYRTWKHVSTYINANQIEWAIWLKIITSSVYHYSILYTMYNINSFRIVVCT